MIIFGTRGLTSTAQTGTFHCPRCGPNRAFNLRRVRRWFTLYFIPVIPLDTAGEYVECRQCAGTFGPQVLTYDPVAEQQRTLEEIKRVLVLVALASGPPSDMRVANLQQAVLQLTGVHIAPEELWQEFSLAQSASAQLVPYVQRIAPQFNESGKRMLVGVAIVGEISERNGASHRFRMGDNTGG